MKQNYYEILEVDKNASPEIIKKAYSTLAKKYHPDLQNDDVKHLYEEKLKLINEAYEILSDNIKREEYNKSITNKFELLEKKIESLSKENEYLKKSYNIQKDFNSQASQSQNNYDQYQIKKVQGKAYYDSYIRGLKNRGYTIKYKKEAKDYLKNFIAFFLTMLILFFLWQLPFVRNFILENSIIQSIISIFNN